MRALGRLACLLASLALAGCSGGGGPDGPGGDGSTPPPAAGGNATLRLASPAFGDGGDIPRRHACDGEEVSPPLDVSGIPDGTVTLALTVVDRDVPTPEAPVRSIDHWVVWDVPANSTTVSFPEGAVPQGATEGANDFGQGWLGPCPPPGSSAHRYNFTAYALDARLGLPASTDREGLDQAIQGHVLAQGSLVGRYTRQLVVAA
jgi:Raf kinase inhibitor-like YbhB/YbcL family protein